MGFDDIPRRIQHEKFVPAETAIQEAVEVVEAMPADTRLTEAVILLGQARDKVADYVDGVGEQVPDTSDDPPRCAKCHGELGDSYFSDVPDWGDLCSDCHSKSCASYDGTISGSKSIPPRPEGDWSGVMALAATLGTLRSLDMAAKRIAWALETHARRSMHPNDRALYSAADCPSCGTTLMPGLANVRCPACGADRRPSEATG